MTQWTFIGRILPERFPLSINLPEDTYGFLDMDLRLRMGIRIGRGQFAIPVIIEEGSVDPHTLKNIVEHYIRISTDFMGYRMGTYFDIDIISALSDNGVSIIFGRTKIPRKEKPDLSRDRDLIDALLAEKDYIPARLVLASFREAMRSPGDTSFFLLSRHRCDDTVYEGRSKR